MIEGTNAEHFQPFRMSAFQNFKMNNDQTVYRPAGRVVTRRIGADNLLVPVSGDVARQNAVFPVNDTGLFIWEQLIAGRTLTETAQRLTEQFSVELSTAVEDCKELVQTLVAQSLLEIAEIKG